MKPGKWIATIMGAIFIGSFIFGIQASSEPDKSMIQQAVVTPEDKLFADWINNHQSFKKPSRSDLKTKLTPLQFKVTQKEGTERPFKNEYWNNKKPGIYVDIISGEPLFSSTHKFKSGTGWPSFYRAISENAMVTKADLTLFGTRTELRSRVADSHLGHVFDDGPKPTGKRYCINSASLRFIPREDLNTAGYGKFLSLFD